MGCSATKTFTLKKGSVLTEITKKARGDRSPPNDQDTNGETIKEKEELDPRLPMTARQQYGITKSWKAISRNMTNTSINMFVRLFETNTEVWDLFATFKDLETVSDLRGNRSLENHAMMVMCTIDETITNMDDLDYVIDMLQRVGKTHTRFQKFRADLFWKIEEPFLLAIKETLGDRYTVSMELTYKRTIRFVVENLIQGFKKQD